MDISIPYNPSIYFDPGPDPTLEDDPKDVDGDVEMTIEGTGFTELPVDHEKDIMDTDPVSHLHEDRIIIAIDFGTTFSSVAYVVLPKGKTPDSIDEREVESIGNYPSYEPTSEGGVVRHDVPTELWYDDGSCEAQIQYQFQDMDEIHQLDSGYENSCSSEEDCAERVKPQLEISKGTRAKSLTKKGSTERAPATQYWGFGVQEKLDMANIPRDEARPLARFKLNLDQNPDTEEIRGDLRILLRSLMRRKIINSAADIYTDYLTHLLKHTKQQLLRSSQLHPSMLVQFVLCVPAKWPVKACRIMQSALEQAVQEVEFSERDKASSRNLFMISEPEAAAEYTLAEARSTIYPGETIVIIDAGGGTVDAVTYECHQDKPLRLSEEVVAPASKLCGASYIDERFERKLLKKLASETYLVKKGKTLKSIAQSRTTVFERGAKRRVNTCDRNDRRVPVHVEDLEENENKNFRANRWEPPRKTIRELFAPSLEGTKEVLENQLELAESRGCTVQKVILTGGFGQSPSLRSYLEAYLKERRNINGWQMDLVVPQKPSTAIARGAVLRALNKRFGPARKTQCSYGFLRSEPYEPDIVKEHLETKCRIHPDDGERYVDNTIFWVIQKGDTVQNMQEFSFDVKHTFALNKKELLASEQLWMSDSQHKSHYRKTHSNNKGAEAVGEIEANLTDLRDKGLIEPQSPSVFSTHYYSQKKHWEVHYEVVLIVEGRSIRYEARWPVKSKLAPGQQQRVLGATLVGIASAFQPGTA